MLLRHSLEANAAILDNNAYYIILKNATAECDVADLLRISMDDTIRCRLRNSGADFSHFLQCWIEPGSKTGNRRSGEPLITCIAWKY